MADERSTWEKIKDGFKPSAVRADENIARKTKDGNQWSEDMKLSQQERAEKARKGFLKRVHNY